MTISDVETSNQILVGLVDTKQDIINNLAKKLAITVSALENLAEQFDSAREALKKIKEV